MPLTKEEQTLCEKCPSHKDDYCGYISRGLQHKCSRLETMMIGYEQACDDLALTWQDMETIANLVAETDCAYMEANMENDCNYDLEDMYKEVLRKFNEQRNGSDNE